MLRAIIVSGKGRCFSVGVIFTALFLSPMVAPTALAASWTPTGSINETRNGFTATLLPTGKVLMAGGGQVSASSVELYDPATGVWTYISPMQLSRYNPTATLLPNGKVLVAGGASDQWGNSPQATPELYDPATGVWAKTGSMITARFDHTATLLPNGKVLVVGGAAGNFGYPRLASAELYDPVAGTWTGTEHMGMARVGHTATLLPNGKVLVVGGSVVGYPTRSAELYDPATETWAISEMNVFRQIGVTATLLANGKVLVAGGDPNVASAELYDPATGVWTKTGNMTTNRDGHTATLLANGKVLVAGGDVDAAVRVSAELYDPATGVWGKTGNMTMSRDGHTATLLPNGQVQVVGGSNDKSAELYDPAAADLWVSVTSLSPSGQQGQNAPSQTFEVWNTGAGTLSYTISQDAAAWLSISPTSGTSTGEHDTITVTYATSSLVKGTYKATITVTGASQTKTIAVTLTVTLPPALSVSRTSLSPSCQQGQNAASQTFEVWNSGEGTLSYTISQDAAWLAASPASGTSTGEHNVITVGYATSALAPATYNATITISGASQTKTIAVTLTVIQSATHTITATAGPNGSITPTGAVVVNHGASQSFTISPAANYTILDVLVDGQSVGQPAAYTFTNVTADHTIAASFVRANIPIITDRNLVGVLRGGTASFQVKLGDNPQKNVTVTVARQSGSPALSIQGSASLTFTSANWNVFQMVTLAATADKTDVNQSAVFGLSGPNLTAAQVTATKVAGGDVSAILDLLLDE